MCKCAATVLAAMSCANVANAADTTLSSSSNISINIGISNDGNERWNVESGGLMLGWNNAPGLGQVQMGKSLDLSWFEIVRARYVITSGTSISLGAGLDWRNYRITTPNSRFVENAGTVSLAGYENEVFPNNSRLKTLAINVPLMDSPRPAASHVWRTSICGCGCVCQLCGALIHPHLPAQCRRRKKSNSHRAMWITAK